MECPICEGMCCAPTESDLTIAVRVDNDLDGIYAISREGDRHVLTLGPASASGLQLALRAIAEGELLAGRTGGQA